MISSVRVTIVVPRGRGLDVVLSSADKATPEPTPPRPRIIISETMITLDGQRQPWSGRERVCFDVPPGSYRASIDGMTWTPIVVAPSPGEQHVEIERMVC